MNKDIGDALWQLAQEHREKRARDMPDAQAAVKAMMRAYNRLEDLGWRPAIYCPKDGTVFLAIEPGSTGIFDCHYEGEWPKGSWWLHDGGDLWPSRPALFKLKEKE